MAYDSKVTYYPGVLKASVTFTNTDIRTGEGFKDQIEHALALVALDLNGTIELLPDHDDTGVILGNG